MTRANFEKYVSEAYCVKADYPFEDDLCSGVFRHTDSGKWFAIAMNVPRRKIGLDEEGNVDIANLKCPPEVVESLVGVEENVFRAYHMNKMHWLTVTLDDRCEDDLIRWLVDISYALTSKKSKRDKAKYNSK